MGRKKEPQKIISFQYSERVTLRPGDVFRAKGGPTYKGNRVGEPGLYKMLDIEQKRKRTYILAHPVDKHGVQTGGVSLLYVSGKPYPLKGLENWIIRPYKIVKRRERK